MVRSRTPRSYNRCSNRPPSISKQMAGHRIAFPRTHLNMLVSPLKSCLETWEWLHRYSPTGVPHERNRSELVTVNDEAMQSALNVQTLFRDMSPSSTSGNLSFCALGLLRSDATCSNRSSFRKPRCCWAVSLSGNRQGFTAVSPRIAVRTLTLNQLDTKVCGERKD
jgi:hypothetical protein